MTILGGYQGKLLEVDLTEGATRSVPLPPEHVLRRWVGCTSLGLHLLCQEVTPDMKATDPECPVFIMTGPLTGSLAPSSSNWAIVSLNNHLQYHPGFSQSHGYWGARLKHAGWDGIIVRGASQRPVYLWIDDDRVELRDASRYWGQDTFDTTRHIQLDHQDIERISVASIGPGGENLLPGAAVRSDRAYGCHKGSPGVVWGAKKLKAIAVRGSGKVPIADYAGFVDVCDRWKQQVKVCLSDTEAKGMTRSGFIEYGMVPGKNFSDPEFGVQWGRRWDEETARWKISPVGSWQCDLRCHHDTLITTGPMAGTTVTGFAGEIPQAMGSNLGIEDPGTSLALAGLADGLGLDGSEVPHAIAMVMEAYSSGLLTLEDTDGIDLSWGNYEGVVELLNRTVQREGIGAILAKGLRPAAKELGIEDLAIHIKGVGTPDHDIRVSTGLLFQCLVASGAGPVWQSLALEPLLPEPDLGYEKTLEPGPEGKAEAVYKTQVKKLWEDATGCCIYVSRGVKGSLDIVPQALSAAVGWTGFNRDEALQVGERIVVLQRLLALYRGYKPEDDFDIAKRLLDPLPSGPAKGRALGPHLARMRREYYGCLGWDPNTGAPLPEALRRVGLDGYKMGRV